MQYAFEKQIGTRTIMGTDWPLYAVVYKVSDSRPWLCAILCNGIVELPTFHLRKKDAVERADWIVRRGGVTWDLEGE